MKYTFTKIITLIIITNLCLAQQVCRTEEQIPSTTPDVIFFDNGDGTVVDLKTELMWAKCPLGKSGNDCDEGIETIYSFNGALELAATSTHAGYINWRLPNIKEFSTLIEEQCYDPAINTNFFPNTYVSSDNDMFFTSNQSQFLSFNYGKNKQGVSSIFIYTEPTYQIRLVRDLF